MTEELVQISFKRYRDKSGNPACAADFAAGKFCWFYQSIRFGTVEQCYFTGSGLNRRIGDALTIGTLIPNNGCPLWTEEEING